MFITIQPEVYEDIFYQENIMAAHKTVTHLTLVCIIDFFVHCWFVQIFSRLKERTKQGLDIDTF